MSRTFSPELFDRAIIKQLEKLETVEQNTNDILSPKLPWYKVWLYNLRVYRKRFGLWVAGVSVEDLYND